LRLFSDFACRVFKLRKTICPAPAEGGKFNVLRQIKHKVASKLTDMVVASPLKEADRAQFSKLYEGVNELSGQGVPLLEQEGWLRQ